MQDRIERAERRTQSYWYADGLAEMAVGALFALIGLLFLIEHLGSPGLAAASFSALGLPVVVIGGGLAARWAVARAKERITYPRTGYVAYRQAAPRRKGLAAAVAAGMAIVVVSLFALAPASLAWIPALEGLAIGGFWLAMGYSAGVVRFYALAIVSALAGLSGTLLAGGDTPGSALYFGLMGVALLVSGALTLRAYLAEGQAPALEGDDAQ